MKVVALVSGGKDSCFSIDLCEQHGHQVVALANLLPADSSIDELDSYMYQTVGHQLVAAYAACTGLPLYRRRITGCSNSQELSYSATSGDEVEDLLLLLAYIKEHHPDITAVASGAIASDYQRLRVESVCSRLGLVSLAYLWHQPQDKLLSDMITNNIEAVLVKVAAIGLDPHKHLGKTIHQLQPHLRRLRDLYGCNVCGEGGEYETLTLDCPAFKFGRIVLDDWQVVLHSPDSIAPVGVLHPTAFHVECKQQTAGHQAGTSADQQQQQAEPVVIEVPAEWTPNQQVQGVAINGTGSAAEHQQLQQQSCWHTDVKVLESAEQIQITATVSAAAAGDVQPVTAAGTAVALGAGLSSMTACLSDLGVSWSHSLFVHMYLADMAHFGAANAEYCKHLPQVNPPSRACVQVPLPMGCPVLLDVLFTRGSAAGAPQQSAVDGSCKQEQQQQQQQQGQPDRRILHVQSISSWAPSCIGPYSQATSCNGLVYMAGQIPLDPATMNIIQPPAASTPTKSSDSSSSSISPEIIACQVWRTLCSCQAVAVAVKTCVATASLALTVYLTESCADAGGQAVVAVALEEMWANRDTLDSLDIPQAVLAAADEAASTSSSVAGGSSCERQQAAGSASGPPGAASAAAADADSDHDSAEGEQEFCDAAVVDDYLRPPEVCCTLQPAVLYVTVPALPRGALLEIQPILLDIAAAAGQAHSSSSDDEEEAQQHIMGHHEPPSSSNGLQMASKIALQPYHGVVGYVTPAADMKCTSRWSRILVHLQKTSSPANSRNGSTGSSIPDTSQLVAAAAELAAVLADLQQSKLLMTTKGHCQHQQTVCMFRCYHESNTSVEPATGATGGACVSWYNILSNELQRLRSEQRCHHQVAVQYVPVSSVASSVQGSGASWAILEALVC